MCTCGDQRTIFKVAESVLHRISVVLPTSASSREMAQTFGEFFRDKILGMDWSQDQLMITRTLLQMESLMLYWTDSSQLQRNRYGKW